MKMNLYKTVGSVFVGLVMLLVTPKTVFADVVVGPFESSGTGMLLILVGVLILAVVAIIIIRAIRKKNAN